MTRQLQLGLRDELIVDNFAGGGGASTGIEVQRAQVARQERAVREAAR